MTAQLPPSSPEFPAYRLREFVPALLLGWLLGAVLTFVLHLLGLHLPDPCRGHTLLALLVPLVLGPGGLAFTAWSWRVPARAALGLGLVVSSFIPGLFVGALDIGKLRTAGCAGGYVVLAVPGTRSVGNLTMHQGETRQLTGRIGGFNAQTHPGLFVLSADSTSPGITVHLNKHQVSAGESFGLSITVAPGTPINTYTAGVEAQLKADGQTYVADGSVELDVRP